VLLARLRGSEPQAALLAVVIGIHAGGAALLAVGPRSG
jgi:hypothetical protein